MIARLPKLNLHLLLFLASLAISAGCESKSASNGKSANTANTINAPTAGVPLTAPAPPSAGNKSAVFENRATPQLEACEFHNGRQAGLNSILEIVGGGVGCLDIDQDGFSDLFFPRGGTIDRDKKQVFGVNSSLLRNTGYETFQDITQLACIVTTAIYSHGVSSVDYDNDGWNDLLVYGYRGVVLLRNQGDGTFIDVTAEAGLQTAPWTTTAAWLDVDRDQVLDLYLGSYVDWSFENNQDCKSHSGHPDVCSPNAYSGVKNQLYLSQGDGCFKADDRLTTEQLAKSLGSLAAEFQTGKGVGLYVANDLLANFLFTRRGDVFEEHGLQSGVAVDESGVANGSMGVALFDFNQDRLFDLFVTNFEHELMALYLGVDGDLFQHASRQKGLNRSDLRLVGFGVVPGDFDSDGDEDLVFLGGHVHYHPDVGSMSQLPAFLQNEGGRTLNKIVAEGRFFAEPSVGRGLATADLDNDGDLDLIATNLLGAPTIVDNTSKTNHQWLGVNLVGTKCSRTPIGTTVEITPGEKPMVRQFYSGGSYLSQSQSQLHFAWPTGTTAPATVTLTIRWPGQPQAQSVQVIPNQLVTIVQE